MPDHKLLDCSNDQRVLDCGFYICGVDPDIIFVFSVQMKESSVTEDENRDECVYTSNEDFYKNKYMYRGWEYEYWSF